MRFTARAFSALLVLALLVAGHASAASSPAQVWLTYLFQAFKTNAAMRTGMQRHAASQSDPALKKYLMSIAIQLSDAAMAAKASPMIEQALTPQELAQCAAFATSPTGRTILATSRPYATVRQALPALDAMPGEHQQRTQVFLSSPCYKKTLQVLSSPQFNQAMAGYGKELACAEFGRTDREALATLRGQGLCR